MPALDDANGTTCDAKQNLQSFSIDANTVLTNGQSIGLVVSVLSSII